MTFDRYTSRTTQFRRQVLDALKHAPWPRLGDKLVPVIGRPIGPDGAPYEVVFVDRVVGDSAEVTELGLVGREERITATIVIDSCVPGMTEDAAVERGEQLADVVQQLFYDYSGPLPGPRWLGVDGERLSAQVTRCELTTYGTSEGFGCTFEVDVQVTADI